MITCPSCQQQNEAGAAFCDNCGYDLRAVSSDAVPATPAPTPQASGEIACPSCAHNNGPGSTFCENCGNPLGQGPPAAPPAGPAAAPPASGQACPSCGHPTVPGGAFCENCGASLGQVAPVSPPAAPPATPPAAPPVSPPAAGGLACPSCGHQNMPGTSFCENCGAQMSQVVAHPPVQQPPQGIITGRLVVKDSNATINIPSGKSEVIIGREDPSAGHFPEIDLDPHGGMEGGVSRKHAKLFMQGNQLMIEAFDTPNKTYVNKQQLNFSQPQVVSSGTELCFGKLVITYYDS